MKIRTQRKRDESGKFVDGKAQRRLNARVDAYNAMVSNPRHELKVQHRINTGGYRRPGSMKK